MVVLPLSQLGALPYAMSMVSLWSYLPASRPVGTLAWLPKQLWLAGLFLPTITRRPPENTPQSSVAPCGTSISNEIAFDQWVRTLTKIYVLACKTGRVPLPARGVSLWLVAITPKHPVFERASPGATPCGARQEHQSSPTQAQPCCLQQVPCAKPFPNTC